MKAIDPRTLLLMLALLLEPGCAFDATVDAPGATESPAKYSEYAGTFIAGPLEILEIDAVDEWLAAVPPFWGSKPYFAAGKGDVFTMALPSPKPGRTLTFYRDKHDVVTGLVLANVDGQYDGRRFRRYTGEIREPGQLFLDRKPGEAARAALADTSLSLEELSRFARLHLMRHPTRAQDTVVWLEVLLEAHPDHAALMALYGYALVSLDRRSDARPVLEAALLLDPDDAVGQEGLRRLRQSEPAPGDGYRAVLPFSLGDAYAAPTNAEIDGLRELMASRDLSARDVEVVHEFELTLEHGVFDGHIVRHKVSGDVHFGAVLVPRGAGKPLPVLLDAKGVNESYSPRDISRGTKTMHALGAAQTDFVVVIPSMRGNQLIIDGHEFASGGDASDAWDGATDDTLALLNATLEITDKADPEHIAIIGYSRGGTVALLAGERDSRIDLVLNVVGPVDHFEAMNPTLGWSWAEVLADTMSDGTPASLAEGEEGSQTFDHFFDRVLTENETLQGVRRRLIASSPLYFVETLPETHSYYGAEDRFVPLANPQMLRTRLESLGLLGPRMTIRVFEGRGHDTDPLLVQRETARRLAAWAQSAAQPSVPR